MPHHQTTATPPTATAPTPPPPVPPAHGGPITDDTVRHLIATADTIAAGDTVDEGAGLLFVLCAAPLLRELLAHRGTRRLCLDLLGQDPDARATVVPFRPAG